MRNQRAFHLRGTEPAAIHFEQVIRATDIEEVAILILVVLVSRSEPVTLKSLPGFVMLVPVSGARGISLDQKRTNFPWSHQLSVGIDDLCLIPGDDLPAGSRPH